MTVNVEAAQRVLDNPEMSSSAYHERLSPLFGRSTIKLDEPELKEYRNLIAQAFTRKANDEWHTLGWIDQHQSSSHGDR
jgi:cytochrome P450